MGLRNSKPSFLPPQEINPNPSILLPEDIIEEILSRVPAKPLSKFKCVSKSWRSLIGNKLFIKKHIQNIARNRTCHWKAIYNCTNRGLRQCSMQSYLDDPYVDPSAFDDPKNKHLMTAGVIVVGHCNGVLCILKEPGSFFFWNQTTKISIELPKLELSVTRKYGFGWDEGSDAYKLFVVASDEGQNIGKVYYTKTHSWKTVDHGCLSLSNGFGVFASGKINWLKKSGHQIETFDLNSDVSGMMDNPCKPQVGESVWLYEEIGYGCLSIACRSNTTNNNKETYRYWVMEQYGQKESWVEDITHDDEIKSTSCCCLASFCIESLVSPV